MHFPKSNSVLIFLVLIFNFTYSQTLLKNNNNSLQPHTLDSDRLDFLVQNDSLYKATSLINDAISYSKKHNLQHTLATSYLAFGEVLTITSNYNNAELYLIRALKIYDSLNNDPGRNKVLSGLTSSYLLSRNYKKFDSIYPIAQNLSEKLNSELYFINLDNQIKKKYFTLKSVELLKTSDAAIKKLNSTDFNTLTASKNYDLKKLKIKLEQSYKYYNAIAHIKTNSINTKDYSFLFSINEFKLKEAFNNDYDIYRKLATLNYYKYLYYRETKKNLDSANKYLLKSDSYKYDALIDFDDRNAKNGELIYKITNAEQELDLANRIRKKDAKTSKTLLLIAIFITFLLILTLTIFFFYIKAKKNIYAINTELKASNDKLIAIDKDRLEFFSILSHELRTPIYGISGLATLIDQEKNRKKQQSYLDSLISSSNYISILIDNILHANKLRFEEKSLREKPDKISKIITHVINTVKVAARDKGLKLKTNIKCCDENELLIDKVAFSQILINLVYNAIRYTKEGHVSIIVKEKTRTTNDVTLRFEINDTGIGIKKEHRAFVFNAFENKTFLQKNSSGSGLGLYIVKTLLKSHNSDIDFTSEPNVGSSFFFEITFKIAPTIKINAQKPITTIKESHILVVDDNKINLLITKNNIEKIEGFHCETITNGREAISMIKNKDYDIVLMDINMPDMDGFEATKHIRMFNTKIPILALTALNSKEIIIKSKNAGINQIITKPYIFEDFKAIILDYAQTSGHHYSDIDLETI